MKIFLPNRTLSPKAIAIVVTGVVGIFGFVELKLLEAKELADNPPVVLDTANCTKCHTDAHTLKRMREKEGKCNFLFKPDGTFREKGYEDLQRKMDADKPSSSPAHTAPAANPSKPISKAKP